MTSEHRAHSSSATFTIPTSKSVASRHNGHMKKRWPVLGSMVFSTKGSFAENG